MRRVISLFREPQELYGPPEPAEVPCKGSGNPQPLFEIRVTSPLVRYAVTRDAQRFLVPTPVGEAGATFATVVINWTAGIKR